MRILTPFAHPGATPPAPDLGPHLSRDGVWSPATAEELTRCEQQLGAPLPPPLRQFLEAMGGGSFGGGLLHVLGACRPLRHDDLATWNQPHDWKTAFPGHDLEGHICFADDLFGNQFCFRPDGEADPPVLRFDIQMGEWMTVAPTLSAFLTTQLAADGAWLLGADFLQEYRNSGRLLEAGQQLSLIIPMLLGGSMEPDNLRPVDPATNLYVAGQVVTRIKPLPPGTEVRGFRVDSRARSITFETRAPRS